MKSILNKAVRRLAMGGASLVLLAGRALGEDGYQAPEIEAEIPWKSIGVIVACLVGVTMCALMNSRRTSQEAD
jgi:hypothetical protein